MIYYLIIMYNIMVLYHFIFNNFFCFDDILVLELRQPIRIGISTLSLGTYMARKENLKDLTTITRIDIWLLANSSLRHKHLALAMATKYKFCSL